MINALQWLTERLASEVRRQVASAVRDAIFDGIKDGFAEIGLQIDDVEPKDTNAVPPSTLGAQKHLTTSEMQTPPTTKRRRGRPPKASLPERYTNYETDQS